jgi:hypothetical protein
MLVDGSKGTKSARKAMWAEKKKKLVISSSMFSLVSKALI